MKKINFRTLVKIFVVTSVVTSLIVNTLCLVSKRFREWLINLPDKNLVFWKRVFYKTKELFLRINQLIQNAMRKHEKARIKFDEPEPRKYHKLSEEWRKKIEEAETIKFGEIYQKDNGVYDVR